jgi:hypothetical protein
MTFSDYDIFWPDGRPVCLGLSRFCRFGSRLLLGRKFEGETILVRLTVYPLAGLNAALTRRGTAVRCRRLYALHYGNTIRLHFLDGTPTEAVFHAGSDEPQVLRWLQADRMGPGEPFWFDLASQTLPSEVGPGLSDNSSRREDSVRCSGGRVAGGGSGGRGSGGRVAGGRSSLTSRPARPGPAPACGREPAADPPSAPQTSRGQARRVQEP